MQPDSSDKARCTRTWLRRMARTTGSLVLVVVPILTILALTPLAALTPGGETTSVGDPIAQGHALWDDSSAAQARSNTGQGVALGDEEVEVLLNDWQYTQWRTLNPLSYFRR